MKATLVCPKCQHRWIWHIRRATEEAAAGSVRPLAVMMRPGLWSDTQRVGAFELFICHRCGYAEWYATEREQLEEDPARGVRLIKNDIDVTPEGGPYR
jgi:predicted nucleic-acid-binding Zn-ribbon protein